MPDYMSLLKLHMDTLHDLILFARGVPGGDSDLVNLLFLLASLLLCSFGETTDNQYKQ